MGYIARDNGHPNEGIYVRIIGYLFIVSFIAPQPLTSDEAWEV